MNLFTNRYLEITHTLGISHTYLTPIINPPDPIIDPIIIENDPHEISIIKFPVKSHVPYNVYTIENGYVSEEYKEYVLPIVNMKINDPYFQVAKYINSTSNNINSFEEIITIKLILKTYYRT